MWTCSYCGHENEKPSKTCKRCTRAFEDVAPSEIRKVGLIGVGFGSFGFVIAWFISDAEGFIGEIGAPLAGFASLVLLGAGVLQALTGKNFLDTSDKKK